MDEYIERKALREAFDNADADVVEEYEDGDCDWGFGRQNILEVINSVPPADVAPVLHGRWVKRGCKWQCTQCKVLMSIDGTPKENLLNYCPNCGAKMECGNDG